MKADDERPTFSLVSTEFVERDRRLRLFRTGVMNVLEDDDPSRWSPSRLALLLGLSATFLEGEVAFCSVDDSEREGDHTKPRTSESFSSSSVEVTVLCVNIPFVVMASERCI